MNISLTPELEKMVTEKVDSGFYHSASEVIRAGLRLLAEQDEIRRMRLMQLRTDIAKGLGELDAGKGIPAEKVMERLRQISRKARAHKE